jgi:hypothetical protein
MWAQVAAMETLQDYELARQERMWDAVALWSAQRIQGGIYLLGYHAEMTLKSAYFRLRGEPANYIVDRTVLRTTVSRARLLGVTTPDERYHSPRFWRDILLAERLVGARPLSPQLAQDLRRYVDVIYARWAVEMRYRAPMGTIGDLEVSISAIDWLDRNYVKLYS